jgi:hypothetical protein
LSGVHASMRGGVNLEKILKASLALMSRCVKLPALNFDRIDSTCYQVYSDLSAL